MSESSKMGLFGSKDDNTETKDVNKQPVKPNETPLERNAPYNVDSDSETYDTEALSIMDINDIIGIQAESASDSTLESEFAALSEVITDIKSDELASRIGRALDAKESDVGRSDRNRDIGSTKDKGSEKDSPKEDIYSQTDDKKSPDSAGMAGINKSLRLIGEAYISEDSQEADSDELLPNSVPSSVSLSESLRASKNENAKGAEEDSNEIDASDGEQITLRQSIVDDGSTQHQIGVVSDQPVAVVIKPVVGDLKSMESVKSADSTDSSVINVSTKQLEDENKTESMDVDSTPTQDVPEDILIAKPSCNKSEESVAYEKVKEDSKIELVSIETVDLPKEPVVEEEEPMEVDQPNEEISDKIDTEKANLVAIEEVFKNKPGPLNPVVTEETAIVSETISPPEESKKSSDKDLDDVKTSPESKNCESLLKDQTSKADASNCGTEEVKTAEIVEEEIKRSSNNSKDEKIAQEKLEMETDNSEINESFATKVEVNSPTATVVELIIKTEAEASTLVEGDKSETWTDKKYVEQEMCSDSIEQVCAIGRHDIMLVERIEMLDSEPMEIEDSAAYHKTDSDRESVNDPELSDSPVDIVKPATDIVISLKQSASDELVDTATYSRVKTPENIKTSEIVAISDIAVKESAENETIVTSSVVSENSAEIGKAVPNITLNKCAKDESSVTLELSENSAKTVEPAVVVTSNESTNDAFIISDSEALKESSIMPDAMETEDITLEDNSKGELVVSTLKLSEKSTEVVENVPDINLKESFTATTEEIAIEDEKMEVDTGTKKEKQEYVVTGICRSNIASQEPEESPVSIVQHVTPVEGKTVIEKVGDSDIIEDPEKAEKTVKETIEIPSADMASQSSEMEIVKSIDETDEGGQESKKEENVPSNVIQKSESSTKMIHDIVVTETLDNVIEEVAEDEKEEVADHEKEEVKSEGEKEEVKSEEEKEEVKSEEEKEKVKSKEEKEEVKSKEEKEEVKSEDEKEKNEIVSEKSESSTEKIPDVEVTKAPDKSMDESAEDKKKSVEPEAEDAESLISTDIFKSSTDKIDGIKATETLDDAIEKNTEETNKNNEPKAKEDETVPLVSIENSESLTASSEIKTLLAPVAIIEKNVEVERDEAAAITKEEEKKSLDSIKKLELCTISSGIEIAEVSNSILNDVEDEKKDTEAEAKESPISNDNSVKTIGETQSTKTTNEAMVKDVKEKEDKSKSKSKHVEKEAPIVTETSAEVLENHETDNSQQGAEKSVRPIRENEAESCCVFSKPEASQQETSQSDMLNSSINPDDVKDEEDPVEEGLNLSLNPDITECQEDSREDAGEKAQQIGELSVDEMPVDAEEIEGPVDINLSLDSEEKAEESPNVQDESVEKLAVEDSVDESSITSAAGKPEQSDERLEKPTEDDDDNSKDIMSTMVREPEIYHDEQSQNTQEMMDSILETDSSNFNKILDDEEGVGAALACANELPLEEGEIDELTDKLPSESEEMLNKALDDPMSSQNIDSLEGLLDLDLIQEGDESNLKSVDPIVAKVMNESEGDIETKDVDVSLLLEETDQGESVDRDEYVSGAGVSSTNVEVLPKVVEEESIAASVENLLAKSAMNETIDSPMPQLETTASSLADNDIDAAFDLPSVGPNPVEADQSTSEESKLELAEDLLREIAIDEERKMKVAEKLLLETTVKKDNGIDVPADLLQIAVQEQTKVNLPEEALLTAAVEAERGIHLVEEALLESSVRANPKIELSEDISLGRVDRDQVLAVAMEIENLPPNTEISELESAVKFLQESEEQSIDSPLVLSPKMVDSVVDEITQDEDVKIFVTDGDICDGPSALVTELENIIPDPIAISEAEIISEAAKLENERKTKLSEEAKLQSPISTRIAERKEDTESTPPRPLVQEVSATDVPRPETPKTHREPPETTAKSPSPTKVEQAPLLKKSAPIPKISILEERLKEPPKIEIPSVSEVSRISEIPTTPKTSLLIQRDSKLSSFQKMLESPKASDKTELKIVDTPRKDADKHDFENVGSPRIILKIAKSAIADCGEPRSPKSPKIRSATNSPNPDDSPGQKLGKIKLKLSKGGHPSIISNENVEEICGQWHTEGTSSLSPLGMKIKFSKTGDASIIQTEKYEATEETKEPPKHKFEEAKRTESPIGMKIKFSKTGDASIVQQDSKESTTKHKDKSEITQGSPKRNESPIGMKIKFSKSGDASIIQPEKSESAEDHREGSSRGKDKLDVPQDAPRRTESPLGMKFKLFKTGDASIVASEINDDSPQETKRTDSPLGMKIKLSKTRGSASIVPAENSEDVKERLEVPEVPRRTESPLGMKIKFSKTGDASIIHEDTKETAKHKERAETSQESVQAPEVPIGIKNKVTKSRDTFTLRTEVSEETESVPVTHKRSESSIGMKFKLSKTGDASIVHSEIQVHAEDSRSKEKAENSQENQRKPDAAIGMKIKFSKTGDASIIQPQLGKKSEEPTEVENEHQRSGEVTLSLKKKLQRCGDASIVESEKKDKSAKRKETDSPLEMKIKLSKTGHPTIVACDNYGESSQRAKDTADSHKHKESTSPKEMPGMKMLKSIHSGIHGTRAELTIEPVQLQNRKSDGGSEASSKRKDLTISPIESKKAKLEAKLSQMLPEVTIQPIMPREQKQIIFDAKASSISRQQMNVISQEISITQVRSNKAIDLSMTDKLKSMLAKNATTKANAECEIIEHRPELIIVNENSNSSQDVMIIEEVPVLRGPDAKVPKKRGRPRRNPVPLIPTKPIQQIMMPADTTIPRDPLALDVVPRLVPRMVSQIATQMVPKENERPKRSCSRQKSYAPPRRGRGRGGGRGKRKMEIDRMEISKKPRIDQDLNLIEQSTTALITIGEPVLQPEISHSTSELYKALRQPPMDHKMANAMARVEAEQAVNDADLLAKGSRGSLMDSRIMSHLDGVIGSVINKAAEPQAFETEKKMSVESLCRSEGQVSTRIVSDEMEKTEIMIVDDKMIDKVINEAKDNKDTVSIQDHQNWLTPSSKKLLDVRNEGNISSVQVIDEETRMSAESSSRSQTPARNMSLQAPETIVNEESQGSVLSTATTESEKVKVKNRRMEISFDPDEGPFTVDKIVEYEWPLDLTRKGETFMIQEQISQYLGVKSFKRKYPDLKRRMVDMEERNYLRENALVSEAMCDMGLTAVSSSEVLDVMCNDFPDQYEEYRKYIRERQMKEHSKKQKELTAAANAERNRIDLAEMAVQSALSWNVGLNKARRESRKCSLDLQTFTIHVPKKQQKVEEESRQSHYPVALIPGQYTNYYREYTPAELRYYPLNTVLYGPMKPNERKLDSQSEGSQSDSDSDSSSDDSSSSSSDGTQDTEESQSTMDEVDVELSRQKEDIKSIKCKMCLKHLNKFGKTEVLIQCGTCNGYVHPSCIDLTLDMVPHIQAYAWQCTDCKTCAQCHDPADEDKMLFCDMCDRGYHIYCVGLRRVPQGRWHCQECAVCASCGSREAGGANSDRNSVAQWQHEYKKGDKNTRVYVSTLCVPCSKLWRKGRYCPHCSRCHTVPRLDLEANLVHCSACDKYLHLGCVETKDLTIDRKNYLCDFCQPSRQQMVKPLVSKVFRT